jgi:probable HAF family extracellular repeat protein
MTDLGTLGGMHSFAHGINTRGQVVGMSYSAAGEEHAFLWENGVMRDLDTPGNHSTAHDINERGQVVGGRYLGTYRATMWHNGTVTDLGTLGGQSEAMGISPSGFVVGTSYVVSEPHAFLWVGGTMTDLWAPGTRTSALGVSPSGEVVGTHWTTAGRRAVRWVDGVMEDLGDFGGPNASAKDINARGQIVGEADPPDRFPRPFAWKDGVMTDLGSLGGDGFANAINARGQIVGYSFDGRNYRATLWQKGGNAPPTAPVDDVAPTVTNLQPDPMIAGFVLNPDPGGDGHVHARDYVLEFDAFDPPFPDGSPGSGVDETGCLAAGPCANIAALVLSGPAGSPSTLAVDNKHTPVATDPDFRVWMHAAGTPVTPEGDYVVELRVPDNRGNVGTASYQFSLDISGPVFGALNPAPVGSMGTDAQAIVMSIGGSIVDANVIELARLGVYVDGTDRFGTGADGVCDATTDHLLSVAASEIDRNAIDHPNGTGSVAYNESFQIEQPDTGAYTVTYCFIHRAEDGAKRYDGANAPNATVMWTQAVVRWNAG